MPAESAGEQGGGPWGSWSVIHPRRCVFGQVAPLPVSTSSSVTWIEGSSPLGGRGGDPGHEHVAGGFQGLEGWRLRAWEGVGWGLRSPAPK